MKMLSSISISSSLIIDEAAEVSDLDQHDALVVEQQQGDQQQLSKVDELFSMIPAHQDLKKYYNIWQRLEKKRTRDNPWKNDQERQYHWSLHLKLEYSNQQPPLSYQQISNYIDHLNTAKNIFGRYTKSNDQNEDKAWLKLIIKRKYLLERRIALGHAPC